MVVGAFCFGCFGGCFGWCVVLARFWAVLGVFMVWVDKLLGFVVFVRSRCVSVRLVGCALFWCDVE